MSPGEVSPRLRKARANQRGENAGKISGQELHSARTAQKSQGKFNPCEISEKTVLFIPLSSSMGDAPGGEYGTAYSVFFRSFTTACVKQRKRICSSCAGHRWEISEPMPLLLFHHEMLSDTCCLVNELYHITNKKEWRKCKYEAEKFKIISK